MKKHVWFACALLVLSAYACSPAVREDVNELGNDAKRDVKKAARNIGDAAQDATD